MIDTRSAYKILGKIQGNRAPWDLVGHYLTAETQDSNIQYDRIDSFG